VWLDFVHYCTPHLNSLSPLTLLTVLQVTAGVLANRYNITWHTKAGLQVRL
jgi:hypothetical protein